MEKLQALDEKASTGTAIHEEIQPLTQNASTLDEKSFNQMIERALTKGCSKQKKFQSFTQKLQPWTEKASTVYEKVSIVKKESSNLTLQPEKSYVL